jgi:hypothetical protein
VGAGVGATTEGKMAPELQVFNKLMGRRAFGFLPNVSTMLFPQQWRIGFGIPSNDS